jgi:hypothetical protein
MSSVEKEMLPRIVEDPVNPQNLRKYTAAYGCSLRKSLNLDEIPEPGIAFYGKRPRLSPRRTVPTPWPNMKYDTNLGGYRWSDVSDGIDLLWTETNGPPVTPPLRQGFGTRVVEQITR